MAIQMTQTAYNPGRFTTRATAGEEGWTPRFDEPAVDSAPPMRRLAAIANPVVNSLTELVQPQAAQLQDTASINTDDDELRGVFAEMAMDRQNRVAARAQLAQSVQEDWTKTQEEVRTNEQARQTNMSNMWRSTFNPYGGGMMPMPMPMTPMTPMGPGMTPGMAPGMVPQLGMQVQPLGNPMQPGMPGTYPAGPGMPMTGTYSAYPAAPGTAYPAPPGTTSAAMMGAPPYYYR